MESLWNDLHAAGFEGDLGQRVYSSRLLGADSTLVMHGGGNTSLKSTVRDLFGEEQAVLYVKGSGWDLATIESAGFAPCRLRHLLKLAKLPTLSDTQMAAELRSSLTDPAAPSPSVEAILHAILPARFVDHTHADAILSVCNCQRGEERIREIYADRVVVIPYVMPGFRLARLCAEQFAAQAGSRTEGMLLMSHGLFTFGNTAKVSYQRMIDLVTRAEEYLSSHHAWAPGIGAGSAPAVAAGGARAAGAPTRMAIAALRQAISRTAGTPMIMSVQDDADSLGFARRSDVGTISQQGPITPDHVIRTKRVPMLGRDVSAYAAAYREYFAQYGSPSLTMLDAAPRVVLDAELGLCSLGRSAHDARIVQDIYRHTMQVIARAEALGGWRALPARDIFEVEYWDLEQAKLKKSGGTADFGGEVALITGSASGIGRACVEAFLRRGAAVVALDRSATVTTLYQREEFLGLECDLTDETAVDSALDRGLRAFGGLDVLVLNAGIFPPSTPLSDLSAEAWRPVMRINLEANLLLMRLCHPLLKLAARAGRMLVIGSKNVLAPGPGAGAYSASKAALQQLARVAALEWAQDGIRVNTVHPNAVFDTGLWTPEVLASRAASYGMSVERYKRDNLLQTEVTSADVAQVAAELCGPAFSRTTGAQIAVDGGNVRVV